MPITQQRSFRNRRRLSRNDNRTCGDIIVTVERSAANVITLTPLSPSIVWQVSGVLPVQCITNGASAVSMAVSGAQLLVTMSADVPDFARIGLASTRPEARTWWGSYVTGFDVLLDYLPNAVYAELVTPIVQTTADPFTVELYLTGGVGDMSYTGTPRLFHDTLMQDWTTATPSGDHIVLTYLAGITPGDPFTVFNDTGLWSNLQCKVAAPVQVFSL